MNAIQLGLSLLARCVCVCVCVCAFVHTHTCLQWGEQSPLLEWISQALTKNLSLLLKVINFRKIFKPQQWHDHTCIKKTIRWHQCGRSRGGGMGGEGEAVIPMAGNEDLNRTRAWVREKQSGGSRNISDRGSKGY